LLSRRSAESPGVCGESGSFFLSGLDEDTGAGAVHLGTGSSRRRSGENLVDLGDGAGGGTDLVAFGVGA